MSEERFKQVVAAILLFIKDEKILLHRRKNTGWEDGSYSLPSGHLNGGEKATGAAVRESYEELGVKVKPEDVKFINISHIVTNSERVHISFQITKWEGEIKNKEPEKSEDLKWFPLNQLPENINPFSKQAIECYLNKILYAEFGWDKK